MTTEITLTLSDEEIKYLQYNVVTHRSHLVESMVEKLQDALPKPWYPSVGDKFEVSYNDGETWEYRGREVFAITPDGSRACYLNPSGSLQSLNLTEDGRVAMSDKYRLYKENPKRWKPAVGDLVEIQYNDGWEHKGRKIVAVNDALCFADVSAPGMGSSITLNPDGTVAFPSVWRKYEGLIS